MVLYRIAWCLEVGQGKETFEIAKKQKTKKAFFLFQKYVHFGCENRSECGNIYVQAFTSICCSTNLMHFIIQNAINPFNFTHLFHCPSAYFSRMRTVLERKSSCFCPKLPFKLNLSVC